MTRAERYAGCWARPARQTRTASSRWPACLALLRELRKDRSPDPLDPASKFFNPQVAHARYRRASGLHCDWDRRRGGRAIAVRDRSPSPDMSCSLEPANVAVFDPVAVVARPMPPPKFQSYRSMVALSTPVAVAAKFTMLPARGFVGEKARCHRRRRRSTNVDRPADRGRCPAGAVTRQGHDRGLDLEPHLDGALVIGRPVGKSIDTSRSRDTACCSGPMWSRRV